MAAASLAIVRCCELILHLLSLYLVRREIISGVIVSLSPSRDR